MTADENIVTTRTHGIASDLGALMRMLLTGLLVLVIGAGGFGLIVYYIVSKINDQVTLTLILCLMGLGVLIAALGVGSAAVYFVRRMGGALTEQAAQNQREMAGALVHLVQETRESRNQNEKLVNAVLGNQVQQPLQLTGSTRTARRFTLGQFTDANGDGKDDDDIVEVWVKSGSQYKRIEHSFALMDDFIRMANPNRSLWNHANDKYTATACIIESIDGSPLMREGNGWQWRVPHAQVMKWWSDAQQR